MSRIHIQSSRGTVNLRPVSGRRGPPGPGSDITGEEIETQLASVPQRVADALADDDTVAVAAAAAVGDALVGSGFPEPIVLATNLTTDPRLNTTGNWFSSTGSPDFSGEGVVLTEVGNPGSVYIYEKAANAHTTGAADKWSVGLTFDGLTNVSGTAYIYLKFWKNAGPSTQGAPLAIRSTTATLTASGRVTLLNQVPPTDADRVTVQIGVNGLSGGGLTVRLKNLTILRSTATKVASDVAPIDGTLPYCRWTGAADASTSERIDRMVTDTELLARYGTTDQQLLGWAASEAYQRTGAPTVDSDGFITTSAIAWPDGGVGTFTLVTKYIGPGVVAVDAYTLTHVGRGRKITQAAPTRDAAGNPTTIPALTIGAI